MNNVLITGESTNTKLFDASYVAPVVEEETNNQVGSYSAAMMDLVNNDSLFFFDFNNTDAPDIGPNNYSLTYYNDSSIVNSELDNNVNNSYAQANNFGAEQQFSKGTLMIWFKYESMGSTAALIGLEGTNSKEVGIQLHSTGTISTYFPSIAKERTQAFTLSHQANIWQHIALTYDSNVLKVYFNGSLAYTETLGTDVIKVNKIKINGFGGDHLDHLNYSIVGQLDNAAFFTRDLTASEITTIYNETNKN